MPDHKSEHKDSIEIDLGSLFDDNSEQKGII